MCVHVYVCNVCLYVCMHVMYVCMHVCRHACMYVMYVCVYEDMYLYAYSYMNISIYRRPHPAIHAC